MDTNTLFYLLRNLHIILESLPISSSGHLELINNWIARFTKKQPLTISTTTNYLMHIPTLIIVGIFLAIHESYPSNLSSWNETIKNPYILVTAWAFPMLIANAITFACSLLLKLIKKPIWPLYSGFFITACSLLSLLKAPPETGVILDYQNASLIGLVQGFSLLPGVSRLALTVVAGIWLGLSATASFYYSLIFEFFLILGAVCLALYASRKKALSFIFSFTRGASLILASALGYAALELVLHMTIHQTLYYFGFYMLILAFYLFLTRTKKITHS